MNHTPAEIIQSFLVEEGLGNTPVNINTEWPIYVAFLPDTQSPANALCVMDSTPIRDGRLMTGKTILHFGIQVLLRSLDYNAGYFKSGMIFEALEEVQNAEVVVDSTTYIVKNVSPSSGVLPLGMERETAKRRWMFSLNFNVTI